MYIGLYGTLLLLLVLFVLVLSKKNKEEEIYSLEYIKDAKVIEIKSPYIDKNMRRNRMLAEVVFETFDGDVKKQVFPISEINKYKINDLV